MKVYLKDYIEEIDNLLNNNKKITDDTIKKHLIKIGFFQHERLIHLIVTVLVGIGTLVFFGLGLILENVLLLVLTLITLVLFTFYIFHYYFLENSVQKLYEYYWKNKKS